MRVPAAVPRNIFAWMLLLSAAAVLLLWIRSHYTDDAVALFVGSEARLETIGSSKGRIGIVLTNLRCGHERTWTAVYGNGDLGVFFDHIDLTLLHTYPVQVPAAPAKGKAPASILGDGLFGFVGGYTDRDSIDGIPESQLFYVLAPHWAIALLLALVGTWPLLGRAARQQRRRARGLCVNCGYDLRETKDRCSECGTPVESATSSPAASLP